MTVNNLDGVPWMLAGARHSADLGRGIAYAASEGNDGVVLPGDFRVVARVPATTGVDIGPGGLYIKQRAANVHAQTYLSTGKQASSLDGPPSDPNPRSYLVIIEIRDPQFGYPAYAESEVEKVKGGPYAFPVLYGPVASGVTKVSQVPELDGKAVYALARIDVPADTTTITSDMVIDLRKLATPKTDRFFDSYQHDTANVNLSPPESGGDGNTWNETWAQFAPLVEVPEWATHYEQVITLVNVRQFNSETHSAFNAQLGGLGVKAPWYTFEYGDAWGDVGRSQTIIASNGGDCSALAGQTVQSRMRGRVWAGGLFITAGTHIIHDIQFYQRTA